MPSKNTLKDYESGAYYHLYNRGVNKRTIFKDPKDYSVFLSFLKLYLSPPPLRGESSQVPQLPPSKTLRNYYQEIELLAYCLMPNHFHLMVKQNSDYGIDHFMRSLSTKYVRYFNSHYDRIGPLFQGPYKAVRIYDEYQFTYLTKYIHRNPLSLSDYHTNPNALSSYKYSSYANYLGIFKQSWVKPEDILVYFSKTNPRLTYQAFVEEPEADDIKRIARLTLDLE